MKHRQRVFCKPLRKENWTNKLLSTAVCLFVAGQAAAATIYEAGIDDLGRAYTTHTLDMFTDPVYEEGWGLYRGSGSQSAIDGVLTVKAPSYYEIVAPSSIWEGTVSNLGGWVIETRMSRDSSSIGTPGIWVNDGANLFFALFDPEGLRLTDAFSGGVALVDTSAFHTYRFEGVGDTLNVIVDGSLARSYLSSKPSGGSFTLMFGDLNDTPTGNSISNWDYFSVTTFAPPVPEADTYAMMLAGLGLVGFMARRRNEGKCSIGW